jgi:hypothetical protein
MAIAAARCRRHHQQRSNIPTVDDASSVVCNQCLWMPHSNSNRTRLTKIYLRIQWCTHEQSMAGVTGNSLR